MKTVKDASGGTRRARGPKALPQELQALAPELEKAMAAAWKRFEDDDDGEHRAADLEAVREEARLALSWLETGRNALDALELFAEDGADRFDTWLGELVGILAVAEDSALALELVNAVAAGDPDNHLVFQRPWLLAVAGDREQAAAQAAQQRQRWSEDPVAQHLAGLTYEELDLADEAVLAYREALRLAGSVLEFRDEVLESLDPLLDDDELRELHRAENRFRAELRGETPATEAQKGPPREPARRTTPKVAPNDPCPCGSGKKFKKCCGAV